MPAASIEIRTQVDQAIRDLRALRKALGGVDQLARRSNNQIAKTGQRAQRETRKAAREAMRAGGAFGNLGKIFRRAFTAVVVAAFVAQIIRATDQVQRMQQLLQASGIENVTEGFETVVQLAVQTRTELGTIAALYSRLNRIAGVLGATSREIEQATTAVAQGLALGGANAQETTSAIIQLSQGLQSGRLQGDELRSVLESAPILAQELAENLGTSVGELRRLAAAGELTSVRVFDALVASSANLNERFQELEPTIGQAFQVAVVGATALAGEIGKVVVETTRLDDFLIFLGESFVDLANTEPFARLRDDLQDVRRRIAQSGINRLAESIDAVNGSLDRTNLEQVRFTIDFYREQLRVELARTTVRQDVVDSLEEEIKLNRRLIPLAARINGLTSASAQDQANAQRNFGRVQQLSAFRLKGESDIAMVIRQQNELSESRDDILSASRANLRNLVKEFDAGNVTSKVLDAAIASNAALEKSQSDLNVALDGALIILRADKNVRDEILITASKLSEELTGLSGLELQVTRLKGQQAAAQKIILAQAGDVNNLSDAEVRLQTQINNEYKARIEAAKELAQIQSDAAVFEAGIELSLAQLRAQGFDEQAALLELGVQFAEDKLALLDMQSIELMNELEINKAIEDRTALYELQEAAIIANAAAARQIAQLQEFSNVANGINAIVQELSSGTTAAFVFGKAVAAANVIIAYSQAVASANAAGANAAIPVAGIPGAAAAAYAATAGPIIAAAELTRNLSLGLIAAQTIANAPGRQSGGPVSRDQLYEVGEGNQPELFQSGGKQYLIPGNDGNVSSNEDSFGDSGGSSGESIIENVSISVSTGFGRNANATSDSVSSRVLSQIQQGELDQLGRSSTQRRRRV